MPVIEEMEKYGRTEAGSFPASVIVVTYAPRKDALKACLDGLRDQSVCDFEVVLVENGSRHFTGELADSLELTYVRLDDNYGPTTGRNIGAFYAKAEVLIFLEDDGIPTPNFVEAHVRSYDDPAIIGVRGRYLQATDRHNPYSAGCYDLGEEIIPAMLNVEGNCSVKKSNFVDSGGWSTPVIYAHEGMALTYELTKGGKHYTSTIYNPRAVIYHDNNKTITRSLYLSFVMGRNMAKLIRVYPDLKEFAFNYESKIPLRRSKKSWVEKLSWGNLVRVAMFRLHDACVSAGERYEALFKLSNSDNEQSIVDLGFFSDWLLSRQKH